MGLCVAALECVLDGVFQHFTLFVLLEKVSVHVVAHSEVKRWLPSTDTLHSTRDTR